MKPNRDDKGRFVKKEDVTSIVAYKGFDKDLKCRGFQFEVGQTYHHAGEVKACVGGFHSCENPFDVWSYYGPIDSRFAKVSVAGGISRHGDDSKIASAQLTVSAELKLPEFITAAINYLMAVCKIDHSAQIGSSGDYAKIEASGENSVALDAGLNGNIKSGTNGCMALTRWVESESRYRVTVAYVGENGIKADTWYMLNADGEFVEVES